MNAVVGAGELGVGELDGAGVGLRSFDSGLVPGGEGGSTPTLDVPIRMPDSESLTQIAEMTK